MQDSTTCGGKVVVLLRKLFGHLKIYVEKLQPVQNGWSNERSNAEKMTYGAISSAMTGSFERTDVFNKSEYPRVSPTRIWCNCVTFGCMEDGIDSGFFHKHALLSSC